MAVTSAQLRADFIEFASTTNYPDATINFWLVVAGKLLRPTVWLDMLDPATELFVCHQLVLARRNTATAATGGVPGQLTGSLSAKAVDKVSAGYDASDIKLTDGGYWNLTTYGVQFLQLARMFGAGGVQL